METRPKAGWKVESCTSEHNEDLGRIVEGKPHRGPGERVSRGIVRVFRMSGFRPVECVPGYRAGKRIVCFFVRILWGLLCYLSPAGTLEGQIGRVQRSGRERDSRPGSPWGGRKTREGEFA